MESESDESKLGGPFDNKWGAGSQRDATVPPEIARLMDFSGYYTFASTEEQTNADVVANIIGPGPEEVEALDFIKLSVSSLKPFSQTRMQENRQLVQVLEIYPTGETGYKTAMSLSRLLHFVRKLVSKISNKGDASPQRKVPNAGKESPKRRKESESDLGGSMTPRSESIKSSRGDNKKNVSEIQYHDLRYLENQFHIHEEPTVLVRKHAVLVSLNPLRAIITADRMILIVPDGADSLLYLLHDYMHGIVEDNTTSLSPDIRAYNALFSTIIAIHQQEYMSVCSKVEKILNKFQSSKTISVDLQEAIRVLKNRVSSEAIKVAAYQRLLRDLLSNDEDLALMNLSVLKDNEDLYRKPLSKEILSHREDVSDLFESYLMDYNTLATKLDFLRARMQNTNELISFRLDSFRNELLIADTTLAIVMMALAVGTYVTNIFGMNLQSGITSEDPFVFWVMNVILILIMAAIFAFFLNRYRLTLTGSVPIINSKISRFRNLW